MERTSKAAHFPVVILLQADRPIVGKEDVEALERLRSNVLKLWGPNRHIAIHVVNFLDLVETKRVLDTVLRIAYTQKASVERSIDHAAKFKETNQYHGNGEGVRFRMLSDGDSERSEDTKDDELYDRATGHEMIQITIESGITETQKYRKILE